MPIRTVSLREIWSVCRACEDSSRRLSDILGQIILRAESGGGGAGHLTSVSADFPDGWPSPEPDPCIPPICGIDGSTLAEKIRRLAANTSGLAAAAAALADLSPDTIRFHTGVPGETRPGL